MLNNENKFKNIKLLALDFDGIMTNGKVYTDQDGKEMVSCSRRDGLGIELLQKNNIPIIVISKEVNHVVSVRCEKLKVECWQAVEDGEGKLQVLNKYIKENNIKLSEVAYMGDDLNDIKVLKEVGLAITVSDGHPLVKEVSDYITEAKGGEHAVREICEAILIANNKELIQ